MTEVKNRQDWLFLDNLADYHRSNGVSEENVQDIVKYAQMDVQLKEYELADGTFKASLRFTPIGGNEISMDNISFSGEHAIRGILNKLIVRGKFDFDTYNE